MKFIAASLVAVYFILGFVVAPYGGDLYAAQDSSSERARLEKELAEINKEIAQYSNIVAEYRKQGSTLEGEIKRLEDKIAYLNTQIRSITLTLEKLGYEIQDTQSKIGSTESRLDRTREALSLALQSMYESEQESLVAILLKSPNLSDFFSEFNDLLDLQQSLNEVIIEMTQLRNTLTEEKEQLAIQESDAIALARFQKEQKDAILNTKGEKDSLLEDTKGKEDAYKKILQEKEKTAAEIRQRIFTLLGGGQMTFAQAYDFARMAQNLTGTRAAFLLAILDKESALGSNVGKCRYDINPYYPDRASNPTTMHPTRDIPAFLKITAELGRDPIETLVSCPIPQDGAHGGAMGPSQFIPSTWLGYEDRVAQLTGSKPADPWRNADAFVATGLYIADSLNSCSQFSGVEQERCAAARYYAGGNWQRHLWTYGERVVSRAAQFEEDIKIISQ
ncbi:MAG: lytic murein transglycosylase [Candidatus Harrisonbacteria bacterium]|nr:lytic murein transglycosylase [Candidatus Harrisonbacteria bacterium]